LTSELERLKILEGKISQVVDHINKLVSENDRLKQQLKELKAEIEDTMSSKIKIRPDIIWLEPNELDRSTYKGKIFEKTYEKK